MSEKKNKTITQKINEFQELIAWFDSESFSLESAIAKYDEASKLAEEIEKELSQLKNEVEVIKQKMQ